MRHLLALAALLCAAGVIRQGLIGNPGPMALCAFMCWVCGGWSIAMHVSAASSVADEILDGKDPRTEDRREDS